MSQPKSVPTVYYAESALAESELAESAASRLAPLWAAVTDRGLWAASYAIDEEEFRAQILARSRASHTNTRT